MPYAVLLCGRAGVGKDTLASRLCPDFRHLSFAGALKDHCSEAFSIPRDWFDDRGRKDQPMHVYCPASWQGRPWYRRTPREVLIREGTRMRDADPDVFVRALASQVLSGDPRPVVVSDWRFRNERTGLDALVSSSGWSIVGVEILRELEKNPADIGDLEISSADYWLPNDGTPEDLAAAFWQLWAHLPRLPTPLRDNDDDDPTTTVRSAPSSSSEPPLDSR